jgi:hypothetical protein
MHRKHYVEYFDGRRVFHETHAKEIERRDVKLTDCPSYSYGFRFYDIEFEYATTESGERLEVNHKRVNVSGIYFVDATIYSREEVEELSTKNTSLDTLVRNMNYNDMSHAVKTRSGNWLQFKPEEDQIVEK